MTQPDYLPTGFHTITPYLIVDDAGRLIEFLTQVFNAKEEIRVPGEEGRIRHACVRIGDCPLEMADAAPDWPAMPASLHIYVPDVDATYAAAVKSGAEVLQEPQDHFYGERSASVRDSQGNLWHIATKTEDLSNEQSLQRAKEYERNK